MCLLLCARVAGLSQSSYLNTCLRFLNMCVLKCATSQFSDTGWYPELGLIAVVFPNSSNLAVVILSSRVFKIYFVKEPFENQPRDIGIPIC